MKPTKLHQKYSGDYGFVMARKSQRTGSEMVTYIAEKQGLDVGEENKYAVVCMTHHTLVGVNSLRDASLVMARGDFCEECMAQSRITGVNDRLDDPERVALNQWIFDLVKKG